MDFIDILDRSPATAEEGLAADRINKWINNHLPALESLASTISRRMILEGLTYEQVISDFKDGLSNIDGFNAQFIDRVLSVDEFVPMLYGDTVGQTTNIDEFKEIHSERKMKVAKKQLTKVGVFNPSWRIPLHDDTEKQDELATGALRTEAIKKGWSPSRFNGKAKEEVIDAKTRRKSNADYSKLKKGFTRAKVKLNKLRKEGKIITVYQQKKAYREEFKLDYPIKTRNEIILTQLRSTWGTYKKRR